MVARSVGEHLRRLVVVEPELLSHRLEGVHTRGRVRCTGSIGDTGHHLECSHHSRCVDHECLVSGVDQFTTNGIEVVRRAGRGVDETGEQIGVGHITVPFVAVAAISDQAEIDVGPGGEAARTEQAAVRRRSVEALPKRRQPGRDQLDLATIEGASAPLHVGHGRALHVHRLDQLKHGGVRRGYR